MTERQGAAGHHASAATHHTQAADYHRSSAHQALVAHGHTLHAIEDGRKAQEAYAQPEPAERTAATAPAAVAIVPVTPSEAEHHLAAAQHDEHAAHHHGAAARYWEGKNYALAGHEAHIAHDHALHSVFHGNEAAMHHVEHYGGAGPSAELA